MFFRISILFFLIAIGSLALGVWGIGEIRMREVQNVFTAFLCLSVLSLLIELFEPTRAFRRRPNPSTDQDERENT